MKNKIIKKILLIIILTIEILTLSSNLLNCRATIQEGENIILQADHECNSLLEYWMKDYEKWSYKIVWYVYYKDLTDGKKYPAFCIEPKKEGIGTGYDSYSALVKKETDNRIWRILDKGYMGNTYVDWNLECDDDLYSATKIALHSLKEEILPKDKYILGNRSVDGNSVEDIQRRAEKVLNVAQELYEYGINGNEVYEEPNIKISKKGNYKIENIENEMYYTQYYAVTTNKKLKSYNVKIDKFPIGTKVFNSENQEGEILLEKSFKIAIPINEIKEDIDGIINITDAYIRTNPVYFCESSIKEAQSYVTYTSGYETAKTSTELKIETNNCNLIIKKIDKDTNEAIPNVVFQISDNEGNKIDEIKTNEQGIAKLEKQYPKTINVKEIYTPDKYKIEQESKQVELKLGEDIEIIFENERKKGQIEIYKTDKENNEIKLENVEFQILDNNDNLIQNLITNEDGYAITDLLDIGEYKIKEIKTNEGYILNEEEIIVKIEFDKITKVELKNMKKEDPKLPRTGF